MNDKEIAEVRARAAAMFEARAQERPGERLGRFVAESNRIEGIHREPTKREIDAHGLLLACSTLDVELIERFVHEIQPGASLRRRVGMNVRVGSHLPPPGGPHIKQALKELLGVAEIETAKPWATHVNYETLHPFMDGNGRSGRAIWAWMMLRQGKAPFALGFLHTAYYQALDQARHELAAVRELRKECDEANSDPG